MLRRLCWLIALFLPTIPRADEPRPPAFVATTAQGDTVRGALRQIGTGWKVELRSASGLKLDATNPVSLRRLDTPLPPPPAGEQVLLAGGDILPLNSPIQLVGEKLRVKHPALEEGKETHLPLPAVALVWFAAPEGAGD